MKTMVKDKFLKQTLNIQNLFNLHCDLPFLSERKKIEKFKKLVSNTYNKGNYAVHIRALKQGLSHG